MTDHRPLIFTLAGIVATFVYFGVAEFIAGAFSTAAAPLLILGQAIIPLTPTVMIKAAIAAFGTQDKLALVITIVIVGLVIGGLIGRIGVNRRPIALVLLAGLGLLPVVLGLSTGGSLIEALPAFGGLAAGFAVFLGLIRLGERTLVPSPAMTRSTDDPAGLPTPLDRRAFFGIAAGLSAIGVATIAAGQSAAILARNAAGTLTKLVLPKPATSAAPVPAGAELKVAELTPLITNNDDFYRIDTALIPPAVDVSSWSLHIHGMVEEEVTITMAELLDLPLEEHYVSLACVSNEVGGNLVGNAKWLGYPVRELLARARPKAGADMVLSQSDDGFTASTPLEVLSDDRAALLAVGMNDEPLPREHGFPARLVVPGLYGFVSATKWVTELEVTRFADKEAYWTSRGWSSHGPVLVSSRVDVPRAGANVTAKDGGRIVTAGMAWAQHTGVAKVEVRVDSGEWQNAELSEKLTTDTWRQWRCELDGVEAGGHTVTVRAVDAEGNVQTSERRPAIPGSATGHHERDFTVD